jgi:hypothetical protein
MDEKRRRYERLVQASLLIEEAKSQAMRAARQSALEKSSQCTNEASNLIQAA